MAPSPTLLSLLRTLTSTTPKFALTLPKTTTTTRRNLTTSPSLLAKSTGRPKTDPRINLIRYHLKHPITPRPLRLSRLRALRHWTIQRAWSLFRRKKMAAENDELQRLYQSTHSAMECLRLIESPTSLQQTPNANNTAAHEASSRLYRIALEKRGIFRPGGVPIEYARMQVDTPARKGEVWDEGWRRK